MSAQIEQLEQAAAAGKISAPAVENIKTWLTEPQYAEYVPSIEKRIAASEFQSLDDDFWEIIAFGTGGRRGRMADVGTATINERTIAESAQGLASYLKKATGKLEGAAVVACDTRNRSLEFAKLTACVLAGNGLKVYYFETHRSTPELSLAVRHLNCDIGVMISASHNPPSDNGFKAYWSSGGQVLPPHDKGIVDAVYESKEIPIADFEQSKADGQIEIVGEEIDEIYFNAVLEQSLSDARDINAIYTPLHGVGETSVFPILQRAGFDGIAIFEPQRQPDGNFTNVPDQLPNPERTEVFAPAIELAKTNGAEIILASDPDADRIGLCVKDTSGEFVHVTGNQIGALIADYVLRKRSAKGDLTPDHFVVETLVTTPLTGDIAKSHNVKVVNNLLVGFKYIGRTMDEYGPEKFVFGTEESLGYLAGQYARDKDAGIAALYLAENAAELKAAGKSLLDRLDELYTEHGYYLETQVSKVCTGSQGKAQIQQLLKALRENPPAELAGITMASVNDYAEHEVRSLPANEKTADLPEPQGELLIFDTAPAETTIRIAARPSGTEPKIKFYFFARSACPSPEALDGVKQSTKDKLSAFQTALINWLDEQL